MILCPNCNKEPLYLMITQELTFTIRDITLGDVIIGDRADEGGRKVLECIGCGWRGWVDDYHEVKNGITKLFCKMEEGVEL